MTSRTLEVVLWIGAVAMLATAGVRTWHARGGGSEAAVPGLPLVPRAPVRAVAAERSDGQIAAADPFRAVRHASPIAYRPELEGIAPPPPPPKPPRPVLSVAGILGGPPWDALLDGIPGKDGSTMVHAGESIGGLTVRSITRDSVIVRGSDTTWRLALKRSWQ